MAVVVTKDMPRPQLLAKDSSYGILSGSIAFDNSYPTNGESITDITKYFKSCFQIMVEPSLGYLFTYDKTNAKIKVYEKVDAVAGTRAEVVNTGDLSGITAAKFIALGVV